IAAMAAEENRMPPAEFKGVPPAKGTRGGPPRRPPRGPNEGSGKWWTNTFIVRRLGLTAEQQKKLEETFQQNRIKLIDLSAALEKEEVTLDPLLDGDRLEEAKILAQVDRIAHARAELEKANARMLLAFRTALTPEQWRSLQAETGRPKPPRR